MSLQRIEKSEFVSETMLTLAKFGDYLLTVDGALENLKITGLNEIISAFGRPSKSTKGSKKLFTAHRKRFDRDMGRFYRYSTATTLYALLETMSRAFIVDFEQTYPQKKNFKKHEKQESNGFISNFETWLKNQPVAVQLAQPGLWKQLQDFAIIRNCIVHAHGDLSLVSKPEKIKESVKKTRRISFNSDGLLALDREFVFEAAERVHAFFRALFEATGYSLALPQAQFEKKRQNFCRTRGGDSSKNRSIQGNAND